MPFGMMNSGAILSYAMKVLMRWTDQMVDNLDDIMVHTPTWENPVRILRKLFGQLQQANFTVRPTNACLGHGRSSSLVLGDGAISLQDPNVAKARAAPRLKTKMELRAFLGLVGYFKEFILSYAGISALLSDLLRKGQPNAVTWYDAQERAYHSFKMAVKCRSVLLPPDMDSKFVLRTDASDRGLGPSLMQRNQSKLFSVDCTSKRLSDRERKYSVIEKEALAIVWKLKNLHFVFTLKSLSCQQIIAPCSI
ncbi:Zinc finger protein [Plakobranchus ocellatus]|uniref:Zinc finger protein n=1 Tax=Plakobranchus ocellatus TaxID=259542 RepID=A0AAV4CCS3_9GAST|nr:Zinc finger protein [Plakobranchus ocellatus]